MAHNQMKLNELIHAVSSECESLKYEKETLENFNDTWQAFKSYSENKQELFYKEQIAAQFLKELFDYPERIPNSRIARAMIRAMRVIGDYHIFGRLLTHNGKLQPFMSEDFRQAILSFTDHCKKRNNADQTIQRRIRVIHKFFEHLTGSGVDACNDITPQHISSFVTGLAGYSKKTSDQYLESLRVFFKSLYFSGQRKDDLSKSVPTLYYPKQDRIPSVWSANDIERLLSVIDRGNPKGKRDYALIFLVTQLGLRTSDVLNLKLENINWSESRIEFVQQKTGISVNLPIVEDLGMAIIDYLKYGRPKSNEPYLFLKHIQPFDRMKNGHYLITQYLVKAGIPLETAKHHGLHSLRHTLASRLLEQDVPLEIISSILGHTTVESTKPYLHIDIENLRKCALVSREVAENE